MSLRLLRVLNSLAAAVSGLVLLCLTTVVLAGNSRIIELTLKDGHIAVPGSTIRVDEGARVEFRITSDADAELHLHGYDITVDVQAGKTTRVSVPATVAGRFPVTVHTTGPSGTHAGDHKVLLYYEVYPR